MPNFLDENGLQQYNAHLQHEINRKTNQIINFGELEVDPDAILDGDVKPEMTFKTKTNSQGNQYRAPYNPAAVLEFDVTDKIESMLGVSGDDPEAVIGALAGHQIAYGVKFYLEELGEQGPIVLYNSTLHYNAIPLIYTREKYYGNSPAEYYSVELLNNHEEPNIINGQVAIIGANYKAKLVYWTYEAPRAIDPSTGNGYGWALILYDNRVILPIIQNSNDFIDVADWFDENYINYIGTSTYSAPVYCEDSWDYIGDAILHVFDTIQYSIYSDEEHLNQPETIELTLQTGRQSSGGIRHFGDEKNEKEITSLYGISFGEAYNDYSWAKMYVRYYGRDTFEVEGYLTSYTSRYIQISYYNRFAEFMPLSMINEKGYGDQIPVLAQYPNIDIVEFNQWTATNTIYKPQQFYPVGGGTKDLYFATGIGYSNWAGQDPVPGGVAFLKLTYDSVNKEFSSGQEFCVFDLDPVEE